MSISLFNLNFRNTSELRPWFIDIFNNLGYENFSSGDFTATSENLTGEINSWFFRFSRLCLVNYNIVGDSVSTGGTLSVPFTPTMKSSVNIVDLSGNSYVGYIDDKIYLPDWDLSSETILIQCIFPIKGV